MAVDAALERRVLLVPPTQRDGEASQTLLASAGITCTLCADADHACREHGRGAAAVMLSEESLVADATDCIASMVKRQPVWSDLPVIILSRSGIESPAVTRAMGVLGNASVIERPLRVSTLISVVRAAIRARERQYETREYIDRQREAERAVAEARDAAEAANRAKDHFIAALSHELRTPLSPVVMVLGAMQDDASLPPQMRDDVEMIRRNIELETRLIDDLLDVSRITSGKLSLRLEPVSLHDVLHRILEVCTSDRLGRKLSVTLRLDAAVDSLLGDHARLQQVFWNLLKNAIKFSVLGGRITIVSHNPSPDRIRVEVCDEGVGIAPEALQRVFEAFEQGDPSVTRQFGGLGLGLAISKAVVDMHGGTISATSAGQGTGAVFVVELPAAPVTEPSSSASPQLKRDSRGPLPRILLVEDHPDTARVLSRLLSKSGYSVKTASTAASALRLIDGEPFDLIVSDIGLPDATGYELMQQIRARHNINGIALSGYGMEGDMRRSREAGFVDHVVKPVNLAQLEAVIQRVMNSGC